MTRLEELLESIRPDRERLLTHPVYLAIGTPEALRIFMEHHVFAVWDFMSLLKALQRVLTSVELPWVPAADPEACRLVNEIVLAEESDDDGRGGHASHFELYLSSMEDAGADLGPIRRFLSALREGQSLDGALNRSGAPIPAREFVKSTFGLIDSGSIPAIASAFTLGREDLIPDLFRKIVDPLETSSGGRLDRFRYYLDRHVQLDEGEHGPMALRMLSTACGDDSGRWDEARDAAGVALRARLALWDGMLAVLEAIPVR